MTDRRNTEPDFSWEMLVIDDESKDATYELAASFHTETTPVYAIRLRKNTGKGGAVRLGALHANASRILMADADGATRFSDLEKLEAQMTDKVEVVFGSRDHLRHSDSVQKRNPLRNLLMYIFHLAVLLIIGTSIKDTQCGFKLFSKKTANVLFRSLHLSRWAFDTELVLLCQLTKLTVVEVDVNWTEIPGSKLNVAIASIQMLRDMVLLRALYLLGVWRPIIT